MRLRIRDDKKFMSMLEDFNLPDVKVVVELKFLLSLVDKTLENLVMFYFQRLYRLSDQNLELVQKVVLI